MTTPFAGHDSRAHRHSRQPRPFGKGPDIDLWRTAGPARVCGRRPLARPPSGGDSRHQPAEQVEHHRSDVVATKPGRKHARAAARAAPPPGARRPRPAATPPPASGPRPQASSPAGAAPASWAACQATAAAAPARTDPRPRLAPATRPNGGPPRRRPARAQRGRPRPGPPPRAPRATRCPRAGPRPRGRGRPPPPRRSPSAPDVGARGRAGAARRVGQERTADATSTTTSRVTPGPRRCDRIDPPGRERSATTTTRPP